MENVVGQTQPVLQPVGKSPQTIFRSRYGMKPELDKIFHSRPISAGPNEHSNFLLVYFTFAYYLLLAPFRFRKVGQGQYVIQQNSLQKCLCAVVSALALTQAGLNVRTYLSLITKSGNPVPFFMLFWSCSSLIFLAMLVKGFWTKKDVFLELVNCLHREDNHFIPCIPFKLESKLTIRLLCIVCCLSCLNSFLLLHGLLPGGEWSLEVWLQMQLRQTRHIFLLGGGNGSGWTWLDMFLTGVSSLSILMLHGFALFGELLLMVHVWTLWAPTSGFTAALQNETLQGEGRGNRNGAYLGGLEVIMGQYEGLKRLSSLIEQGVGDVLLFYIGLTLFYYAVCFDNLILTEKWMTRMGLILSYSLYLSILLLSADVVRKMRRFKAWLVEGSRWRQLEEVRLAVILDELAEHSVGISASGVFTLTYGFVGTVVSVLITYFIIRLQSSSVAT